MQSSDLTKAQVEQLQETVGRALGFLNRLVARMDACGFLPADPLRQGAKHAQDGVHHLWIMLHYAHYGVTHPCSRQGASSPETPGERRE
jgi:hypothetical protein